MGGCFLDARFIKVGAGGILERLPDPVRGPELAGRPETEDIGRTDRPGAAAVLLVKPTDKDGLSNWLGTPAAGRGRF